MELSTAESDAKELAMKDVALTLSKTDQLDRLEQYKRKITRKKATLESQLRNAVQTQLEGVQTGLQSLKDAEQVVQGIKDSMNDVEQLYQQCADLSEVVRPIKDVNRKHQQLKTTTMHIHNIFNVPEAVKETRELITEGSLLEAHRNLSELEHTRDELLIQLFHGEDAFVDKNTSLHHYFEPLLGLSDTLGQHLWVILHEATRRVSSEPTQVVTALRIVEREERTDKLVAESLQDKNIPLSQLPGRPKDWRNKCFEILETSVSNKFEEMVPMEQERLENKLWLGEHLTEVASVCFQDLKNVKEKGQKCFPPSYNILSFFITHYHHCLVKLITDLVHMNLNAKDIIFLMVWVGDVRESFRVELDIDFQQYGPLIDPEIEEELQQTCQEMVGSNIRELIIKMLETEKEDWYEQQPPEEDINGAYYSTIGITLFQMIDQNISALAPLGMENKLKVLRICLDAMVDFQAKFKALIEEFFTHHIQTQRREPPFFIHFMIAATNSCRSSVEFAEQLKKRFIMELNDTMMDASFEIQFKKLAEEFESIAQKCCVYLLDVAFVDLTPVLQGLLTKEAWFGNPGDLVGKIEGTMFDYNSDFSHLKPAYHSFLIVEAQHRVMLGYMKALMQKRMVFKKDKDRERACKMVCDEVKRISTMFLRLSHATNPKYSQVIELLAELIKCKSELLPLEISSLVMKHPDIKSNHVIAVLSMRGDLNKSLVTKILQQTTVTEQTDGAAAGDRPTGSSVSMRKKAEERNFLALVPVPNPYSLFQK